MKLLHALALSIALLVALWVYLSIGLPALGLTPWIGFVAWAAYFAAGGTAAAWWRSASAGLAGILLTALTMWAVGQLGGGLWALLALVPVLAFVLVAMADLRALSFTPAAFLGAASFFGSGGVPDLSIVHVSLTWLAGALFGHASQWLGQRMARREAAVPAG